MVMGGDSRSKERGFESRHCILDGHFSHLFDVKICNVCLKRPKINEKEAGVGPFLLKKEVANSPFKNWQKGIIVRIASNHRPQNRLLLPTASQ